MRTRTRYHRGIVSITLSGGRIFFVRFPFARYALVLIGNVKRSGETFEKPTADGKRRSASNKRRVNRVKINWTKWTSAVRLFSFWILKRSSATKKNKKKKREKRKAGRIMQTTLSLPHRNMQIGAFGFIAFYLRAIARCAYFCSISFYFTFFF